MLTFKSITAYREGDTATVIDFDETPAPTLDVPAIYADDQFSQEFQLLFTGDRWSGRRRPLLPGRQRRRAPSTPSPATSASPSRPPVRSTPSRFSAFADFSYDFTDRLHASIGGRYTRDDKDATVFRAFYLGATAAACPRRHAACRSCDPHQLHRLGHVREVHAARQRVLRLHRRHDRLRLVGQGFKSGGWDMRGDAVLMPPTVNGYRARDRRPPTRSA